MRQIYKGGVSTGGDNLKWFFAIPFFLIGGLLFSLTIDDMGYIGSIIIKVLALGCFLIASFIKRKNCNSVIGLRLFRGGCYGLDKVRFDYSRYFYMYIYS